MNTTTMARNCPVGSCALNLVTAMVADGIRDLNIQDAWQSMDNMQTGAMEHDSNGQPQISIQTHIYIYIYIIESEANKPNSETFKPE